MALARHAVRFETEEAVEPSTSADMCFFALPVATYVALSDAAAKQGKTVASLMKEAIEIALKGK